MCVRVLYCTYIQYMHVFVNLNLLMCKSVVIVSVCRFSIYTDNDDLLILLCTINYSS